MATKRYLFIDLFRGWAVITMIETHVVNAWMDVSLRETGWFGYLNIVNGFVAPSFLFIAGVALGFVSHARWESVTTWSPALAKQFRRLLIIWGIGYWLHIPRFELDGWIPRIVESDLAEFYRADILHTIALSIILVYLLMLTVRHRGVTVGILLTATTATVFLTPTLWRIDFNQWLHPAVANYLNGRENPLFPLFPWCVFLWSGVVVSFWFLRHADTQRESQAAACITGLGVILFVTAWVGDRLPIQVFEYENFWLTSPAWILMRLGVLLVLFGGFWYLEHRGWHTSERVRRIGSESLFAYVAHLMIIYTITGHKAALPLLAQDHSVAVTIVLYVALLLVIYFLTLVWIRFRQKPLRERLLSVFKRSAKS